jgi:hypothetical protein
VVVVAGAADVVGASAAVVSGVGDAVVVVAPPPEPQAAMANDAARVSTQTLTRRDGKENITTIPSSMGSPTIEPVAIATVKRVLLASISLGQCILVLPGIQLAIP